MREGTSLLACLDRIAREAQVLLYPALRQIPPALRGPALEAAHSTELDWLERLGLVGAIAVSAYLVEPVGKGWEIRSLAVFAQLFLAAPLIGVFAAPWLVRRTRRGLRRLVGPP